LLKLGYRAPSPWPILIGFLAVAPAPAPEKVNGDSYLRTVRLGSTRLHRRSAALAGLLGVEVSPALLPVLPDLRMRLWRLFDLEASPLCHRRFLRVSTRPARSLEAHGGFACRRDQRLRAGPAGRARTANHRQGATTIFGRSSNLR